MIDDERYCDTETGRPFFLDPVQIDFFNQRLHRRRRLRHYSSFEGKYVDEYHWISDKDTLDMVAIAQSMPGVIAVNSSVVLGYRMAGVLGRWSPWSRRCCPA